MSSVPHPRCSPRLTRASPDADLSLAGALVPHASSPDAARLREPTLETGPPGARPADFADRATPQAGGAGAGSSPARRPRLLDPDADRVAPKSPSAVSRRRARAGRVVGPRLAIPRRAACRRCDSVLVCRLPSAVCRLPSRLPALLPCAFCLARPDAGPPRASSPNAARSGSRRSKRVHRALGLPTSLTAPLRKRAELARAVLPPGGPVSVRRPSRRSQVAERRQSPPRLRAGSSIRRLAILRRAASRRCDSVLVCRLPSAVCRLPSFALCLVPSAFCLLP